MRVTLLFAGLALCSCSVRPAPPAADTQQRPFPDLSGQAVMLLPVQANVPLVGVPAAADTAVPPTPLTDVARAALEAELAYWLPASVPRARWSLPADIVRAAERSPMLAVFPRALPVQPFLRARLEAIGDPLYGDLRKVGTLTDARVALLPVGAVFIPEQGGGGRVHMAVALIDTLGGAVLWYGVVAGDSGARDDAHVVASAARALANLMTR